MKMNTFLKVDYIEPVRYAGSSMQGSSALKGINVWINGEGYFFECNRYTVCDPREIREDAYRQAFGLFKELYDMTPRDRADAFGKVTMFDLVSKNTYEDIVEKLDTWKKEKEKETIRVRDEVYNKTLETRFVVTKIYTPYDADVIVNGLKKDGTAVKGLLLCNVEKTGLHVDNLDSYLEV